MYFADCRVTAFPKDNSREREIENASVKTRIRNKQCSQGEVAVQERRTLEHVKSKT